MAKEIAVISGKGGTGKTSIAGSLAVISKNAVMADCDVDASDLHLLFAPTIMERHDFSGGRMAFLNEIMCINCGICADVCRFSAINENYPHGISDTRYSIDQFSCEGCGLCAHVCPSGAIKLCDTINGEYYISYTRFGPMIHARLGIAEENSGKLVTTVRKEAKKAAEKTGRSFIIIDGAPGIGCPVIASIADTSIALIVTEPTVSGEHDLLRVLELLAHFKIPALVCVNKWDINKDATRQIEKICLNKNIKIAGRVRYDKAFTLAQIQGKTIVEYDGGDIKEEIENLWNNILTEIK